MTSVATNRLQKPVISFIVILDLRFISEVLQESLKRLILIGRNFKRGQHAAEIRAVIAVVEKTDVPSAAQRIEELEERSRPFGELKTAEPFALDIARVPSDHVSHVQLREFVVREIGSFVA